MKRIFISSVQKEFADVRRILKRYVSKNPAYRRFFGAFVFEEASRPATVVRMNFISTN